MGAMFPLPKSGLGSAIMTSCWPMEEGARPQILCSLKETHREEKILSLPLGIVVSLHTAEMEVA